jgi:hypothetical protein
MQALREAGGVVSAKGSPHSDAIRWADGSALIRLLTHDEANDKWACCGWADCNAMPCFRLATPHGHIDYCRDHIDCAIASLPAEWLDGWAYREPLAVTTEGDDIPF